MIMYYSSQHAKDGLLEQHDVLVSLHHGEKSIIQDGKNACCCLPQSQCRNLENPMFASCMRCFNVAVSKLRYDRITPRYLT